MKSKSFSGIAAGFLVSLAVVSCGSAPPAQVTPPPEAPADAPQNVPARDPDLEPPNQAAKEELQDALALMDASRKQAQDIDAPGYFPKEWDMAENQYTDAKTNTADATLGDAKKTTALYKAAAETYDNLARQCVPLFYEDLSVEILQTRDDAIDAGIREFSPNRLEAADQRIDRALEQYEAGNAAAVNSEAADNYYAAAASAFEALTCYHALSLGAKARRLEKEIQERGFEDYDPSNYSRAKESIDAADAAYDEGDAEAALAQAEDALFNYTIVMDKSWVGYAEDLRSSAEAERRNAMQFKANVAVKRDFDQADGLYTRGTTAYDAKDYAASAEYFSQAIPLFSNAVKIAEQKRVVAEDAIQTAETRISQSEQTAREAETLLEGGAQ
jgi:hypothetical protein